MVIYVLSDLWVIACLSISNEYNILLMTLQIGFCILFMLIIIELLFFYCLYPRVKPKQSKIKHLKSTAKLLGRMLG